VHRRPVTLPLEDLWIEDITIPTGLMDTAATPTLLRMVQTGQLHVTEFVTHQFPARRHERGLRRLERPDETGALRVALVRVRSAAHRRASTTRTVPG
jgi:alcohol dehydrogenase